MAETRAQVKYEYEIKEVDMTYEIHRIVPAVEGSHKELIYRVGTYTTKEGAEKGRQQRYKIDEIHRETYAFIDRLIAQHGELLDGDQIRTAIREQTRRDYL